jgi:hypothetical protein
MSTKATEPGLVKRFDNEPSAPWGIPKKTDRRVYLPLLQRATAILLELSLWLYDLQNLFRREQMGDQ